MAALTLVLPDTVFTRALFDGSVRVEDFDVGFEPAVSSVGASARLRGRIEPHYAGGEQVIPDYVVRLARGVGQPLVALPVFLTRGMVHRKYAGRRDGLAPEALKGGSIGVSRLLAATAVYLRGVLASEHGLDSQQATWVAAEPFTSDDSLAAEWPPLRERLGAPAAQLLDQLAAGELDAVLYPGGGGGNWYQWVQDDGAAGSATSHYGDLETLVRDRPTLEFSIGEPETIRAWFARNQVYPVFHMVVLHREVAEAQLGLPRALVDAFAGAAQRARDYLNPEQWALYDREIDWLGADPNLPGLTTLNAHSVEYLLDALQADGMIPRRPSLSEIFPYS